MDKDKMLEVAEILWQEINKKFTVGYCNEKFDNAYGKYGFTVFDKTSVSAF